MAGQFDPYYKWLGIAPEEQPPNHYRLLGLRVFEADPEVISNASDGRMVLVKTHQTGKDAELSQRILNEIAAARVCLLTPAKKAAYDERLAAQLKASKAGLDQLLAEEFEATTRSSPTVSDAPPRIIDAPTAPTPLDPSPRVRSYRSTYTARRDEGPAGQGVTKPLVVVLVLVGLFLAGWFFIGGLPRGPNRHVHEHNFLRLEEGQTEAQLREILVEEPHKTLRGERNMVERPDKPDPDFGIDEVAGSLSQPCDILHVYVGRDDEQIWVLLSQAQKKMIGAEYRLRNGEVWVYYHGNRAPCRKRITPPSRPRLSLEEESRRNTLVRLFDEFFGKRKKADKVEQKPKKKSEPEDDSSKSKEQRPDEAKDKRLAVPSDAERQRVSSAIEETFQVKKERTREDAQRLTRELYEAAIRTDDPVERYVLLQKAMGLADEAGEALSMQAMVDVLASDFEIEAMDMKVDLLVQCAKKVESEAARKSLAYAAGRVLQQAAGDAHGDVSKKLHEALSRTGITPVAPPRDKSRGFLDDYPAPVKLEGRTQPP